MKKVLPLLLMVLVLASWPAAPVAAEEPYDPPTITVDVIESVTPNSTITVTVTVDNTTGTRMWRSKVSLDVTSTPSSIRQYLQFYETESFLTLYKVVRGEKDYMESGESQQATFRMHVTSDMPATTIPIYISLETEIGLCEEGCAPYFRVIQTEIVVERSDPNIFLDLETDTVQIQVGDCDIAAGSFSVPYTLSNSSQTTAFNVNLSIDPTAIPLTILITPQMPLASIKAETSSEGIMYFTTGNLSPGTYTAIARVTYDDYYGKSFSTTKDITLAIVNDAYLLYKQAEEYFAECNYTNAKALYVEAMGAYSDVDNEEMSQRCGQMLRRIDAIGYHSDALDACNAGEYEQAREYFTLASQQYSQGGDCAGVALSARGIALCDSLMYENDTNSSETEQGGGGNYLLEAGLGIVIAGLIGFIILTRKS